LASAILRHDARWNYAPPREFGMEIINALYLLAMLGYCLVAFFFLKKFKHHIWSYLLVGILYIPYFVWIAIELCLKQPFFALHLVSLAVFVGAPVLLLVCARVSWKEFKVLRTFFLMLAVTLPAVGVDAFFIEPHWLTVRHETMTSDKVTKPIKIAVIADIQTDDVGVYEREALMRVKDYNPDLVLWSGDYIQVHPHKMETQQNLFSNILKDVDLKPSIGAYATQGDTDQFDGWQKCFAGSNFNVFQDTTTVKLNGITLTLLSLYDSRWMPNIPQKVDDLHIIVGHKPDFSLKKPPADLLIAGHTHGGQVQIPFFGPLMTMSWVPRQWGGGCFTDIGTGAMLCISRGVGMERQLAPRLRFCCRPELVFIDVLPKLETSSDNRKHESVN